MSSNEDSQEEKPVVPRTAVSLQRMKLEKLMKNPDKPVIIPDRLREKKLPHVPDFVRNVMGSSAGAGSGEFHVYRHLRRKEYTRQKIIHDKGEKSLLDEQYEKKLEENQKISEEKTAKKRAKRLKNKEKLRKKRILGLLKPKEKKEEESEHDSSSESHHSEDENVNNEKNVNTKLSEDSDKDNNQKEDNTTTSD